MALTRRAALTLALIGAGCTSGPVLPADPDLGGNTGIAISGGGSPASQRTVTVGDDFFNPGTVEIAPGDTVTWRWTGTNPHSVTFPDALIDSGIRQSGATFTRFFGAPGTHTYVCTVHPDTGTVIVR